MSDIIADFEKENVTIIGDSIKIESLISKEYRDRLVYLSFHLTRSPDEEHLNYLQHLFGELLEDLFYHEKATTENEWNELQYYRGIFVALMVYTRDIIAGKGEYALFHALVVEWVHVMRKKSIESITTKKHNRAMEVVLQQIVEKTVHLPEYNHPYGSWKDIKYCLESLKKAFGKKTAMQLDIWKHLVAIAISQMHKDVNIVKNNKKEHISLWGRWAPREKSARFGWLARHFAHHYSANYGEMPKYGRNACCKRYRKDLAMLNRALHTVQVAQCEGNWSSIDFERDLTSATLLKQWRAFEYITELGNSSGENEDRVTCKKNFEAFLKKKNARSVNIETPRNVDFNSNIGIEGLVSQARKYLKIHNFKKASGDNKCIQSLNLQWALNSPPTGIFNDCIAMVDTSGSMEDEDPNGNTPINAAIGLGLRIAEGSSLGKRLLTFNSKPSWLNLTGCAKLTEMVSKIMDDSTLGLNSNILAAMELIAEACRERDFTAENIKKLTLVVLSDMDFDKGGAEEVFDAYHEQIEDIFKKAGLSTTHMREYPVPHIIYWNMRNGYNKKGNLPHTPFLYSSKNVSMLSGYNTALLQNLCKRGLRALEACTPWTSLAIQLNDERYAWTSNAIVNAFSTDNPIHSKTTETHSNDTGWWW